MRSKNGYEVEVGDTLVDASARSWLVVSTSKHSGVVWAEIRIAPHVLERQPFYPSEVAEMECIPRVEPLASNHTAAIRETPARASNVTIIDGLSIPQIREDIYAALDRSRSNNASYFPGNRFHREQRASAKPMPEEKLKADFGPINYACVCCGVVPKTSAEQPIKALMRVCWDCWFSQTLLKRVALGWEADPYAAHREKLESMRRMDAEGEPDVWFGSDRVEMDGGFNRMPLLVTCIDHIPDLGRRIHCGYIEAEDGEAVVQNDHAPHPLQVDDPTGDDVAADAPSAAEYMGVRQ